MAGKIMQAISRIADAVKPNKEKFARTAQQITKSEPQGNANSLEVSSRQMPLRTPNSEYKVSKYNVAPAKEEKEGKEQNPLFKKGEEQESLFTYDDEAKAQREENNNNLFAQLADPTSTLNSIFGVDDESVKQNAEEKPNRFALLNENTNPDSTQAYEDYFSQLTMDDDVQKPEQSESYFDAWRGKSAPGDRSLGDVPTAPLQTSADTDYGQELANYYMRTGVDDGTTTEGRTSNYMTGAQYKKYADLGMGGRPVEDIDDNTVYSKNDEFKNFGFTPYIPDRDAALKMNREAAAAGPTKLFNALANAREDATDYTIDGYSGKAIDNAAAKYYEQVENQTGDESRYIFNGTPEFDSVAPGDPNYQAWISDEWTFTTDDGESYTMRGTPEAWEDEDGIHVLFKSGDELIFDDEKDLQDNLVPMEEPRLAGEGEEPTLYVPIDPMVIQDEDGNDIVIPYAQADSYLNGGGERDYGPMGIGKPRYQLQEEGSVLNPVNIVPNTLDLLGGSLPLMSWYSSIPSGMSAGELATHGIDTNSLMPDGTSRLLAEDMDADKYGSNIGASLFMPVTEHFAGNIGGGNALRSIPKLLEGHWAQPAAHFITGIGGEALEEVGPGNLTERLQRQGMRDFYANETGERDETGHPIYDSETPWFDRLMNFVADAPEAAVGGAMLGGMFDAVNIPGYIGDTRRLWQDRDIPKIKTDKTGYNQLSEEQLKAWLGEDYDG